MPGAGGWGWALEAGAGRAGLGGRAGPCGSLAWGSEVRK